jgi:hypothetical protein
MFWVIGFYGGVSVSRVFFFARVATMEKKKRRLYIYIVIAI